MDSNTSTTHTAAKPWPCRFTDLGPGAHSSTKEEGGWQVYGSRVWLHASHTPWTDGQLSPQLLTQWIPGMNCSIQASCKYCRQESWMDGKMVTWVDTQFCMWSKKPAQTQVWQIHLINEDLAQEICLHLHSKGKYVCAMDIVWFLDTLEMKKWLNLKRLISERTAHRWMAKMGCCWKNRPKGQHKDGHDNEDVITNKMSFSLSLHPSNLKCASGQKMALWKLSTRNQRAQMTLAQGCLISHYIQGGGLWSGCMMSPHFTLMISMFCIGCTLVRVSNHMWRVKEHHKWWQTLFHQIMAGCEKKKGESQWKSCKALTNICSSNSSARVMFKAGKNQDGYFINDKILAQANWAMDILDNNYPDDVHVFFYDNTKTHSTPTRCTFHLVHDFKTPQGCGLQLLVHSQKPWWHHTNNSDARWWVCW